VWRESVAAQILFDKALQAYQSHHKTAFVTKFFGPAVGTPVESNIKTTHPIHVPKTTVMNKNSNTKPKQTTLNNFMLDGFLVKTIEKKERAKKAAKKAATEAQTQSLKNEIVEE
jgi:hypothetical protein